MEVTSLVVVQQPKTDSSIITISDQNNDIHKQTSTNNASPSSDELVSVRNVKKLKKRDKSPTAEIGSNETALTTRNNANISNTSLNNLLQHQSLTNNTTGSLSNNNNNNKKEKQRPETWNKIEQQIFFNALREVI
jgi:hypothetical protein